MNKVQAIEAITKDILAGLYGTMLDMNGRHVN